MCVCVCACFIRASSSAHFREAILQQYLFLCYWQLIYTHTHTHIYVCVPLSIILLLLLQPVDGSEVILVMFESAGRTRSENFAAWVIKNWKISPPPPSGRLALSGCVPSLCGAFLRWLSNLCGRRLHIMLLYALVWATREDWVVVAAVVPAVHQYKISPWDSRERGCCCTCVCAVIHARTFFFFCVMLADLEHQQRTA